MNESNDTYCEDIISKKIPVEIIKETDNILAFHEPKPHWKTHIIITTKKHVPSLIELSKESDMLIKELLDTAAEIAESVKNSEGGCVVSTSIGSDQHKKHFHVSIHHGEVMGDEMSSGMSSMPQM